MSEKHASAPVPPGYKRTEVGVIPEDWQVVRLGDIAIVKTGPFGSSLHESDYVDYGTPIITVEHLEEHGVSHTDLPMISDSDKQRLKAYELIENDIVFSRVGSIDRNALIREYEAGWLFSGRLLRVRSSPSKVFAPYLSYHFHSLPFKKRVLRVAVGQTMPSLNTKILNDINVSLPPLPEQKAIARALADADAWIEALERLIAKKRAAKQAAMQDLLSGRVRLPGFSGGWEKKTLKEIALCLDDLRVPLNEKQRAAIPGPYPYCGANGIVDYIDSYLLDDDVILLAEDGGYFDEYQIRPIAYRMIGKIWVNNHAHILKAKANTDQGFLFYSLAHKDVSPYISSGTRSKLNKSEMFKIEVMMPKSKAEQSAIARVLSDMDAEIEALEQQLDKARSIKQGMMQELLTGRIRLVKSQHVSQSVRQDISINPQKRSEEFHEAVLLSVVTKHFSDYKHPIGRFRRTKLVYLLRRHLQVGVDDYLKKAAGPYRPKTKYGGAEKIALTSGYVKRHQAGRLEGFISGDHVEKAESYFLKWYGSEPFQWLNQFRYRKNEELELLTTVDMTIEELRKGSEPVTVATVKAFIHEEPEWLPKLNRAIFSDINIARAMRELRHLFGFNKE